MFHPKTVPKYDVINLKVSPPLEECTAGTASDRTVEMRGMVLFWLIHCILSLKWFIYSINSGCKLKSLHWTVFHFVSAVTRKAASSESLHCVNKVSFPHTHTHTKRQSDHRQFTCKCRSACATPRRQYVFISLNKCVLRISGKRIRMKLPELNLNLTRLERPPAVYYMHTKARSFDHD